MNLNRFDQLLKDMTPSAAKWKGAVIDVADTMYLCKVWFEEYKIPFTAADVLAMANLVIELEAACEPNSDG